MSVDLPLPETPVTHVNNPIGRFKVIFFKLLPEALVILKKELSGDFILFATVIFF